MRIDVHTHLWPPEKTPVYLQDYLGNRAKPEAIKKLTAEGLITSMNQSGIDKAIVSALPFGPQYSNQQLCCFNNYIKQQVALFPHRLKGFCTINPLEQDALSYLEQLIGSEGFKGLKLHNNMQQFYPDDTKLYPIYQKMQEYQLPILFHCGGIGLPPTRDSYGQPIRFDAIACDFPDLPIILGHAGRTWYDETAMMLRKHKNIYADISTNIGRLKSHAGKPMADLLEKVKVWAGHTNTLFLGSDYPFYGQAETVEILNSLLKMGGSAATNPEDISGILELNAEAFCKKYNIFKFRDEQNWF